MALTAAPASAVAPTGPTTTDRGDIVDVAAPMNAKQVAGELGGVAEGDPSTVVAMEPGFRWMTALQAAGAEMKSSTCYPRAAATVYGDQTCDAVEDPVNVNSLFCFGQPLTMPPQSIPGQEEKELITQLQHPQQFDPLGLPNLDPIGPGAEHWTGFELSVPSGLAVSVAPPAPSSWQHDDVLHSSHLRIPKETLRSIGSLVTTATSKGSSWPSSDVCSILAESLASQQQQQQQQQAARDIAMAVDDDEDAVILLRCADCGTPFDCGLRVCRCGPRRRLPKKTASRKNSARAAAAEDESQDGTGGSSSSLLQRLRTAATKHIPKSHNSGVQVIWENGAIAASDSDGSGSLGTEGSDLQEGPQDESMQPPPDGARDGANDRTAISRQKRKLSAAQTGRKRARTQESPACGGEIRTASRASRASRTPRTPRTPARGRRGRSRVRGGRSQRSRSQTRRASRTGSRRRAAGRRASANRVTKRRARSSRCAECGRPMPKVGWLAMVGRALKRAIAVGERPFCSTCWRKLPERRRRAPQPPPEQQQQEQRQQTCEQGELQQQQQQQQQQPVNLSP